MPSLPRLFLAVSNMLSLRVTARPAQTLGRRALHTSNNISNNILQILPEVRDAVAAKKPVVALESTIYTHGYPPAECARMPLHLESLVRANGGVPATIAILAGVPRVGLTPAQLAKLSSVAEEQGALKVSRRDLAYTCALGRHGGTTISGTMILAHLAGIKILGTSGLGGVHRGGEISMDISADLTELGRTPIAVVSSGCKGFLDIPRTLEYLETQGVCVATFANARSGPVDFPAYFVRDSGVPSPRIIQDEKEAAEIIRKPNAKGLLHIRISEVVADAQSRLQISSGMLFANPVPVEHSIPRVEMDDIIHEALGRAEAAGHRGSGNTPFVMAAIKQRSGKSVVANRALLEANVKLATRVAVELSRLEMMKK